jgi:hypothetical protein
MKLCKLDTLTLLSWHGGQSSACYAAGSNSLTGRPVAAETLRAARVELAWCQAWVNAMHEEDQQLDLLVRKLARI